MRKPWNWLLALGLFLLVAAALLALFEWAALDDGYQMQLHEEQHAAQATGLTQDGVARASSTLLDFLRGKRVDLAYTDMVYGTQQRVYGDDEIRHMDDVLDLFTMGRTLRLWSLALGLALTLAGVAGTRSRASFFRALLGASIAWAALIAALALAASLDFERAFVLFHRLLFTNDLWQMTDQQLMIRLLPEAFFMKVAIRIALTMAFGLAVMIGLGALGSRRGKRV